MKYTAVFLIAIVALTFATSPADKVVGKVDSLITASRNEQAAQSKLFASQAQRCKTERAFRNQEIRDSAVAKGAADEQLSLCKTEVPIAKASHKQTVAEKQASKAQLKTVEAEKEIFDQVNLARQSEHKEMLDSISGAYNIIGNFANGKAALGSTAVFVEVAQKVNSAFRIAIKHNLHKHMMPVMSALVQITATPATTVSTSALNRVVEMLRKLEANIRQSEVDRSTEYVKYLSQYENSKALLNVQIKTLSQIIKRFSSYLVALDRCVATETVVFNDASAKFTRNSNILKATIAMCQAYNQKYTLQTKQRNEYVTLLGKLRAFVVSQIASFKSGLYSRKDYTHQL